MSATDQQLLDAHRNALLAIASGKSYEINGRRMLREDAAQIRATIEWLEQRIAAADTSVDETGTGWLLAVFR